MSDVEKAKGMMPKGGSSKMRHALRRMISANESSVLDATRESQRSLRVKRGDKLKGISRYLQTRVTGGNRSIDTDRPPSELQRLLQRVRTSGESTRGGFSRNGRQFVVTPRTGVYKALGKVSMIRGGSKRMARHAAKIGASNKLIDYLRSRKKGGARIFWEEHTRANGKKMSFKTAAPRLGVYKSKPVSVRLSPAQRRAAVMNRLMDANSGMGRSRTRGGAGRSTLKRSDMPAGARGPRIPSNAGKLNQLSSLYRQAKFSRHHGSQGWMRREAGKDLKGLRAIAQEFRQSRARRAQRLGGDAKVEGWLRRSFGQKKNVRKTKSEIGKAKAKTLYVYRPVENADAIIAWAKSQGFASTLSADDLHVTLAFSKTPMNWARLSDDWRMEPHATMARDGLSSGPVSWSADGANTRRIKGGVREVKALGDKGAIVLAFESDTLTERHIDFKRAGASWDYPSFTPHITITYNGSGMDLSKVSPYSGEIVLGEECWEEIKEGAQEAAMDRESDVEKARGMLPGGSPQTYYRMRHGADEAAVRRMAGKAHKNPSRYVKASRYLLSRVRRLK